MPRIELVTGLAVGADHLAAAVCLEEGHDLVPVSPFSWTEFERDFGDDADGKQELHRILEEVEESGGERGVELAYDVAREGQTLDELFSEGRSHYAALGRFVTGHADVLVAFLDPGRKTGSSGGTASVVEIARARQVPSLLLEPAATGVESKLRSTGDGELLTEALGRALGLSAMLTSDNDEPSERHARDRTYLTKHYLKDQGESGRKGLRRSYGLVFDRLVKAIGGMPDDPRKRRTPDHDPKYIPSVLQEDFERADALANHCNGVHRTTFLLIYTLGFVAVLSAVVGHLYEMWQLRTQGADYHPSLSVMTIVEIVALALILGLFLFSRTSRVRAKGTDYRLLAEILRVSMALWPLRTRLRFREPRAQGSDGSVQSTWMTWYALALVRRAGSLQRRFDLAYLLRCRDALRWDLVGDQLGFHEVRVHRFHRLETLIERAVVVLFALALYGCISHAIHGGPFVDYSLVMTAGLPALAAALHGISTQAEFARLERRYDSMRKYLAQVESELGEPSARTRESLVADAQEVSSRMIDEVAEWRWLHAVHDARI